MWVIERDMKQDWIQWVITATQQTVIKHLQHVKHKTNREIKYVIESPQQFHKVGKNIPITQNKTLEFREIKSQIFKSYYDKTSMPLMWEVGRERSQNNTQFFSLVS